jgi:hypothetical protein
MPSTHNTCKILNQNFITSFVKAKFWSLPVHRSTVLISPSYFFNILLKCAILFISRSSKWSFSLRFFYNPRKICIPLLSHGCTFLKIFVKKFNLHFSQPPVNSSPFDPIIPISSYTTLLTLTLFHNLRDQL